MSRIDAIDIYHVRMPLIAPFSTAYGSDDGGSPTKEQAGDEHDGDVAGVAGLAYPAKGISQKGEKEAQSQREKGADEANATAPHQQP